DPRVLEGGARREGLEGLDEAMRPDARQELVHRPGPALDPALQRALPALLPEAERGDEGGEVLFAMAEAHSLRRALRARQRQHRVARAEIDADRRHGGGGHGGGLGFGEAGVYTPRPRPASP